MRKIVGLGAAAVAAATLTLTACRTAPAGAAEGAPSAPDAVERFLAAAHNKNVREMAALFGTSNGSVSQRDPVNDVEKRMRALQCYLTHDTAKIVDDLPGNGDTRQVSVELHRGTLTRKTTFVSVPGPGKRWYVSSFDIQTVVDLCQP